MANNSTTARGRILAVTTRQTRAGTAYDLHVQFIEGPHEGTEQIVSTIKAALGNRAEQLLHGGAQLKYVEKDNQYRDLMLVDIAGPVVLETVPVEKVMVVKAPSEVAEHALASALGTPMTQEQAEAIGTPVYNPRYKDAQICRMAAAKITASWFDRPADDEELDELIELTDKLAVYFLDGRDGARRHAEAKRAVAVGVSVDDEHAEEDLEGPSDDQLLDQFDSWPEDRPF